MTFKCQSDLIIALMTTALILLPRIATTNEDCKGKPFYCVNSTHFKICVDFGGISKTVDDFLIPCPPSTACTYSNYYECEYQIPTTSASLARQSDVTNELFETTVTSSWELLDVITFLPINNNEKSVEWLENSTIASPEIVPTAAGTETVQIFNHKVVHEVLNDMTTESEYNKHKMTVSDLSESVNNDSQSTDSILNNSITSLALTDETNNLSNHTISVNVSSAAVTGDVYSTTESKISTDVFDTMTMSSTTEEDADFKSTNLSHSVITDSYKKNNFSAAVTTENYSDTNSEVSIDQYKPLITTLSDADNISTIISFPLTDDFRLNIAEEATENYAVTKNDTSISMLQHAETTPKNIQGSNDFATTVLTADDLGFKSSLTTETTEKSGTENETLITNNKENTHYTTTLLVPMINETFMNTLNIEINLTVTSDSTSTEQYSTVSDNNSLIETATTTNDMYTNATVTGTSTENERVITNNKVNPHFTKTSLSAPMVTKGLLNTPNMEIYLTATSDSYSTSTEQYSTASDKNSPTETATTIEMYTNATVTGTGTENETLITNNEVNLHFTSTTLSAPTITKSFLNTPNISSNMSITSDSYSTSTEQYAAVSDNNSAIEIATTTNDIYMNATATGTSFKNETVITNNEVNRHFTKTSLSAPMITEGLLSTPKIKYNLTATSDFYSTSTEQYSTVSDKYSTTETATPSKEMSTNAIIGTGTENETLITNNEVNSHFTITTLSAPMITKSLLNSPNVKVDLTFTSDSYSTNTEKYATETATTTNEMYKIATVTGTGTENEILLTNNEVKSHFTTTALSAPMTTESLINTQNIETNFTVTSDSISAGTVQYAIVRDNNYLTETASTNQMYTNAVTKTSHSGPENYSLNENGMNKNKIDEISQSSSIQIELLPTTTVNTVVRGTLQISSNNEQNNHSSLVGSEESLNAENVVTSSDITKFTTVTDLDQMNTQANALYPKVQIANEDRILNTDCTSTTKLDAMINESNLIRENIANLSTDSNLITKSEEYLQKNTPQKDKNSSAPTMRTVSDTYKSLTNKDFQVDSFSTYEIGSSTLPLSDFPSTVGYDEELLSTIALNIVLNNTADKILTKGKSDIPLQKSESHAISDIINNEILETTSIKPTSAMELIINSISSKTTVNGNKFNKNVAKKVSNNTKDEFLRHENGIYKNITDAITTPLPQIADFKLTANIENVALSYTGSLNDTVQELSRKRKSDLSSPVTTASPSATEITESYAVNTKQHMDVIKVKHPVFSTVDETIQNNPTTQNIATETLDGTEDEDGSTQKFRNFDTISTPSVFLHFSKHNHSLTKLNLSTSTSKSSTFTAKHTTNLTIGNLTTTSATQARVTSNDMVQSFSTLEPIFNLTVANEISPTEFKNLPSTRRSYIRDRTGVSSHSLEGDIPKTTLLNENPSVSIIETDPNPSAHINDVYNSVSDDIYISASAKNTVSENFSYGNNLPDYVIESTSTSVIDSYDVNTVVPTLSTGTSFTEASLSAIFNKSQDFKTDKIIDESSMRTEHILPEPPVNGVYLMDSSKDKNRNNIRPTLETNSNPVQLLLPKARIKNISSSINRTTPHESATNMLKNPTAQLNETYLSSNNTSMGIKYKNTTKENVFTLTNIATDNSQIFLTNNKPVYTATLYSNVNSPSKSKTLKGMKVVELEQLVSKDKNKIFASNTTSDIGLLTTENTLSLNPNLSKNIPSQHILSANINKEINATEEKPTTRDSAISSGLNVQDKILKSVNSKHLQNTSINTNESPQYHTNIHTNNFTKQINRVVVNTDANLLTLNSVSKSIVNFNNLSINVENLTRHDQNSSYKIAPNETKGDTNALNFFINADNKQSSSNPVPTNEDKRKVLFTIKTPVKLNNLPSDPETERKESKFNCNSRQRGKYSDKDNCQNFYICIGRSQPIVGKCPNNTVFSEISKQCTRNLSHCVRNNQFQCTSAGRYVDILSDHFYYICAKQVKGYIRYKFQCQKGYHLDKSKLKCILDTSNDSFSASELPSLDMEMDMANGESSKTDGESSKTDGEKSTIESKSKEEKDSKKQKKDFECEKEGNFIYPDDCRKYYQCTKAGKSKFRRKIKKCDSDEVFDSEKRKCVDEESYES